jgi:hypothetical protein
MNKKQTSSRIEFQGGWDTTFTEILSQTTINGSIMISEGKFIIKNIIFEVNNLYKHSIKAEINL